MKLNKVINKQRKGLVGFVSGIAVTAFLVSLSGNPVFGAENSGKEGNHEAKEVTHETTEHNVVERTVERVLPNVKEIHIHEIEKQKEWQKYDEATKKK